MQTVNPGALANKSVHLLPPKLAQGTLFTPFYVNRGKYWEFVMPIYKMVNGEDRNRVRRDDDVEVLDSRRACGDWKVVQIRIEAILW